MSCLDLVIASKELEAFIESVEIDSSMKYAPFRPLSKNVSKFSDHFPIVVTFCENFSSFKEIKKKNSHTIWNTNPDGGWKIYKEITESAETFENIFDQSYEKY